MSYRRGYGCCALSLALVLTSARARGDESAPSAPQDQLSREAFQIDDADPESSVPTQEQAMKSPLKMGYYIMLLIERGQKAEERGDLDAAIKFYRALAKTAPDRSTGHTELCRAYEKRGDIDAAIDSCRVVLGLGGVRIQDHLHFVSLLLKKPSDLNAKEIEDAEASLAHVSTESKGAADVASALLELRCDLATRIADPERARRCVEELKRKAPDDPKTLAFSLASALLQNDFAGARGVIEHARRIALPKDAIQRMERALAARVEANASASDRLTDWRFIAGALAVLAGLVLVLLAARKRRTATALHAG